MYRSSSFGVAPKRKKRENSGTPQIILAPPKMQKRMKPGTLPKQVGMGATPLIILYHFNAEPLDLIVVYTMTTKVKKTILPFY
jgi:hypothetical protein